MAPQSGSVRGQPERLLGLKSRHLLTRCVYEEFRRGPMSEVGRNAFLQSRIDGDGPPRTGVPGHVDGVRYTPSTLGHIRTGQRKGFSQAQRSLQPKANEQEGARSLVVREELDDILDVLDLIVVECWILSHFKVSFSSRSVSFPLPLPGERRLQ
jgi:hypothetical protein